MTSSPSRRGALAPPPDDPVPEPPPHSPVHDERITEYGRLYEAHRRLDQVLTDRLAAIGGITGPMLEVLLRVARTPGGRLSMSELAHQLGMTSGGATRLIDRTAAAGYVERRACPTDRRVQHVVLTAAGSELLDAVIPSHLEDLQREFMDRLTPDERACLARALDKLRA